MATCLLTGTIITGSYEGLEAISIHAIPYDSPAVLSGTERIISPKSVTVVTTSTGEFELELLQNFKFTVSIPEIGFRKTIIVPIEDGPISLWSLTDVFVGGDTAPEDPNW